MPRESKTEMVTRVIAERIRAGTYPPGSQLPSDAELRAEFAVSQQVIRVAVDRLKMMQLVETVFGRGKFVAEHD